VASCLVLPVARAERRSCGAATGSDKFVGASAGGADKSERCFLDSAIDAIHWVFETPAPYGGHAGRSVSLQL
jgi:hypothetical protein